MKKRMLFLMSSDKKKVVILYANVYGDKIYDYKIMA